MKFESIFLRRDFLKCPFHLSNKVEITDIKIKKNKNVCNSKNTHEFLISFISYG